MHVAMGFAMGVGDGWVYLNMSVMRGIIGHISVHIILKGEVLVYFSVQ